MKFFFFLVFAFGTLAQERTRSSKTVNLKELQNCAQSKAQWMTAITSVANISGNTQAGRYAEVLDNCICAILTDEAGRDKMAVKYISQPKYKDKPWVGVVFIETKTQIPEGAWAEHFRKSKMIAEYQFGTNIVIFRGDIPQLPILKGLIAEHEMQHWWQKMNPVPINIPHLQVLRELDAYGFEFSILDKLKLPGLSELISFERVRIRKYLQVGKSFETNFDNPMLTKVFGAFPSDVAHKNAASIIMMKALFAELDALNIPQVALQKKINFLYSIYK